MGFQRSVSLANVGNKNNLCIMSLLNEIMKETVAPLRTMTMYLHIIKIEIIILPHRISLMTLFTLRSVQYAL